MRIGVLCGHEPTLDPRILWFTNAMAGEGHDVRLVGTASEPAKMPPPEGVKTFRLETKTSIRDSIETFNTSIDHLGLLRVHIYLLIAVGLLLLVVYRLLISPIIILVYLLEKIPIVRNITAEAEVWIIRLRWSVRRVLDKLSGGGLSRLRTGLIGYKWYLVDHSLGYACNCGELFSSDWKPEVIVANDPDTLLAGSYLKNKLGCRLVYDAHEFGPDAYLIEPRPRLLFQMYEKAYMSNVDDAMTVTPQIAREFKRLYENSPSFLVLPNATPRELVETIPNGTDAFAEMNVLGNGKVRFLFQGGFATGRGVEELILEFAQSKLDNAVLFIRGPNNSYRKKLIEFRDRLEFDTHNIHFLDSIPEDMLIESAKQADVGLITYLSHIENHKGACPNKLSQYMQAGIFVLSSNLPFVRSIIEQGGVGAVYDDQKPGDLGQWLTKLSGDLEFIRECGNRGKVFANEKFCYEYYFNNVRKLVFGERIGGSNGN